MLFRSARILAAVGDSAEAMRLLDRSGLAGVTSAAVLLELGKRTEALALLDPAATSATYVGQVLMLPTFDQIRDTPEFKRFLATLGLTAAHSRAQAWRAAHPPEKAK